MQENQQEQQGQVPLNNPQSQQLDPKTIQEQNQIETCLQRYSRISKLTTQNAQQDSQEHSESSNDIRSTSTQVSNTIKLLQETHPTSSKMDILKKIQTKINKHLSHLTICDKYIRLAMVLIKTYIFRYPKSPTIKIYQQLYQLRRVILSGQIYQTIISLYTQELTKSQKIFYFMLMIGDLADVAGFWLQTFVKNTDAAQGLIEKLEGIVCDMYFLQCFSLLLINMYKYFKQRKKQNEILQTKAKKSKANKSWIYILKIIRYLFDSIATYNDSRLTNIFRPINKTFTKILYFISSCVNVYMLWR